jgi:hypothetical protein
VRRGKKGEEKWRWKEERKEREREGKESRGEERGETLFSAVHFS